MLVVKFFPKSEVEDRLLKFAVIAARYNGKWIFCRHKERTTWEIPGGHREPDESVIETARRELQEETGAVEFSIKEVCVYGVDLDGDISYGLLCFVEVKKLGELPPEMEIGQIDFFHNLPQELTYPAIQPFLFEHIQGWLNLQSSSNELWDIYDENRNLTGRTHRRGNPMKKGDYHLVVHIWIRNRNGEYLISQRSADRPTFPLMWECVGGSVIKGEDSITGALRETREEVGLIFSPDEGKLVHSVVGRIVNGVKFTDILDVWLFEYDGAVSLDQATTKEVAQAVWMTKEEIRALYNAGKLVHTLGYFFATEGL